MPNSVLAPSPTVVMPQVLAVAFQQSRTYIVDENRYRDGSLQNRAITPTSRKSWVLSSRVTTAQLTALRNFYNDRGGEWLEFYFYDLYETVPIFSYDATGAATVGRYIGMFVGQFSQDLMLARHSANFRIIEIG